MKPSISRLICFVVTSLFMSAFSHAEEDIVLYSMHFPPYSIDSHIIPPDTEVQYRDGLYGVDVELIRAAYATQGVKVTFEMAPWKRMIRDIKAGLSLGVVSCRPIASRAGFSLFSDAVSYSTMILATHKNYLGQKKSYPLSILRQHNTIVNAGWAQETVLTNEKIPYTVVNGMDQGASLILHRDQDVFMTDKESLLYELKQMGIQNQFSLYNIDGIDYKDYSVCFSKKYEGAERLLQVLNDGLKVLRSTGKTQALYDKYGIVNPTSAQE